MNAPKAFSAVEAIVMLVVALLLVITVFTALCHRPREERAPNLCLSNLRQLAHGMAAYLQEFGDDWAYPCPLGRVPKQNDYNGAEWLASLYWVGLIPDPGVFICVASPDSNDGGLHLGGTRESPTFGSSSVSYAGLHHRSYTDWTGKRIPSVVRRYDYQPTDPMASDDTQGTINHGTGPRRGMNVLFVDGHVEFKSTADLDPEHAVGQKGGLLEKLRN
jgi:prepilin-type processing-associated H-X9-DG protein